MIKISDLICQIMRQDKLRGCINISAQISDSLIKVASTRIFAEPEQSFMELPVNSIDSYNIGKPSTGKFGMGFFSMLYWLTENNKRILYITSSSDTLFRIKLEWTLEGLILSYMEPDIIPRINPTSGDYTGTKIFLDCKEGPLTDENLLKIEKHIKRLSNIPDINIFYNGIKINLSTSDKNIEMNANNQGFIIMDNAQGISVTTLMSSLLIPSSSTKPRLLNIFYKLEMPTVTANTLKKSILMITVNDITIIQIERTVKTLSYTFLIKMPPNTSLPIARDDIIYERGSSEERNMAL